MKLWLGPPSRRRNEIQQGQCEITLQAVSSEKSLLFSQLTGPPVQPFLSKLLHRVEFPGVLGGKSEEMVLGFLPERPASHPNIITRDWGYEREY